MRLLVAEKLYSLCPTTEYHDMPINEINKCIDKVNNHILLQYFTLLNTILLFNLS
jgi:hypothetical protein